MDKPKEAKEGKKEKAGGKPEKGFERKPPEAKHETKVKSILRLAGQEVDGSLPLLRALEKIRGIGHSVAVSLAGGIEEKLGIQAGTRIGDLSEDQLSKVEDAVTKPAEYGVLRFMLNRPADVEEGTAKHLVGTSLMLATRRDIDRQKNIRTWVGWRHSIGQKVRGQHNRTTGRSGMTVGVLRKAAKEAFKTKAAAEEKK
jgi:small subunit ribosomal protein S13